MTLKLVVTIYKLFITRVLQGMLKERPLKIHFTFIKLSNRNMLYK